MLKQTVINTKYNVTTKKYFVIAICKLYIFISLNYTQYVNLPNK